MCGRVRHGGQRSQIARRHRTEREHRTRFIQRKNVVGVPHFIKERAQLTKLLRELFGEVVALGEVLVDVVELPFLLGAIKLVRAESIPWHTTMEARGNPAVVIDRTISKHLEILRRTSARGRRIGK